MQIVDGHCHVGIGFEKELLPEKLLEVMDRNGVVKAVICPIEQYIAVDNENGNQYILKQVQRYPERFIGFATINPWYLKKGCDMLEMAYESGLSGLKLNPKLQGFCLYSDIVKPLLEVCAKYKKPVYAHTGSMGCAEPFQLAELAREYPDVSFIMGHSGNTDYWGDIKDAVNGLPNLYLETSHNMGIRGLVDAVGANRVIFGSNMPRSHQSHEISNIMAAGLSQEELHQIMYENILRLVGGMV